MIHFRALFSGTLLLLLTGFWFAAAAQQGFSITKRPPWAVDIPYSEKAMPADAEEAGGSYVLLLDKQYQLVQEAQYRKYVVKLLNEKGLQDEADLSISYDPSFQQLQLHEISVIRDGKLLNKLVPADVKVIQREADAAQRIYDGSLTAVVHLKDVRVGDILTYSYTILGRNPMYRGLFFEELAWQWGVPAAKISYRVLQPEERLLQIREKGAVPKPAISTANGLRIYHWQKENLPALVYESETPAWYNAAPLVQLSEFQDWGAVVKLFVADYQAAQSIPDAQWEALSKELFIPDQPEADKITRLLHFVQNDIRYLGLEQGISAYKPHAPSQVLQQKYGDCKDKALLLCALLHRLGVEAYPALVNTYQRGYVAEQLPTPGAFDHCIVRMQYQDSTYWFDATTNSQGGTFRTASLPHYGQALVMKKGENSLSPIPDYKHDSREIKSYFVITKGGESELTIMSRYKGFEAELQRAQFRNNNQREIEDRYLNYYAGLYPGISLRKELKMRDRTHEVETEENYTIADFWESSTEINGRLTASFYPLYLSEFLTVPEKKLRKAPYLLNYPLQVTEEIILEMPERWSVTTEENTITNEFFTFGYQVHYRHPVITIRYRYELHKDHVPASQIAAYIKEIDRVKNQLGYEIHYADDSVAAQHRLSYPLLLLVLLLMGVFVGAAVLLYKVYDPKPLSETTSYTSIGGWLVLPLIGLCITPLRVLVACVSWDYFDANSLHNMFTGSSSLFNPLLGSILVVELLFNLATGVMAVLLLVLLFKRRSSYPRLMILYLASNVGFLLLELVILDGGNVVASELLEESYTDLAKTFISALIWIPYFIVSERVKQTFTVQRRPSPPAKEKQEETSMPSVPTESE